MVAEVGWPDILEILLSRGANVDAAPAGKRAEDNKIAGSTPLIGATKYNHPECVRKLLAHRANPNHQNQSGISALMLAAEQGYFDCVKLLVEAGANLELAPSGESNRFSNEIFLKKISIKNFSNSFSMKLVANLEDVKFMKNLSLPVQNEKMN